MSFLPLPLWLPLLVYQILSVDVFQQKCEPLWNPTKQTFRKRLEAAEMATANASRAESLNTLLQKGLTYKLIDNSCRTLNEPEKAQAETLASQKIAEDRLKPAEQRI
jgi:hypothetical protein